MSALKIFIYELKNVIKQSLTFTCISVALFTLSIGVLCFSSDMINGYKEFLNKNFDVISLAMYNVDGFQSYEEVDKLGDALSVEVEGVTYYPNLKYGENVVNCLGTSYKFRDELPYYYRFCTFQGRQWCTDDNTPIEDVYSIFLSQSIANELSISVGDKILFEYTNKIGSLASSEMSVMGIYNELEDIYDDFVIPSSFIKDKVIELKDSISFYLELNKPADILNVYPELQKLGLECSSIYVSVEEISLINVMRYILITISCVVLVLTFTVLNNSLTITINKRKKFMAKLKLLGARIDIITATYLISLFLSFLLAFSCGILLSYYFCGYFSFIAKSVLEYPININLNWEACVGLFFGGCLLVLLRYFLFRRKIKKIIPLEFIKEE